MRCEGQAQSNLICSYYLDPLDRGNFHTDQSQNRSILPNSSEKELLNGYFHSRTLFFTPESFRTLPNGFERLFNALFHSTTSEVSRTAKTTPVFFSPHQPPKIDLFSVWSETIQYWEAPGIYYVCAIVKPMYVYIYI